MSKEYENLTDLLDKIHQTHVLDGLKQIPDETIDCIITSPPYFKLRDYGDETQALWGGVLDCHHKWKDSFCTICGAWKGQLGLEPTLDLYLVHLWQVADELYRVLKPSGCMFWVHGDGYGLHVRQGGIPPKCLAMQCQRFVLGLIDTDYRQFVENKTTGRLVKDKEYPQWLVRNFIIWEKANPLPSSVKDRLTNTYEFIPFLVKSTKYYFDLDSIRIPHKTQHLFLKTVESKKKPSTRKPLTETEKIALEHGYDPNGICPVCGRTWKRHASPASKDRKAGLRRNFIPCIKLPPQTSARVKTAKEDYKTGGMKNPPEPLEPSAFHPLGKNPGDVFKIPTQPFPEAHFAVFPERLVEPLIKAGCPLHVCTKCGEPYAPQKACRHRAPSRPSIVLDPFTGSGTTAVVAKRLNRHFIGLEINPTYIEIAKNRLKNLIPELIL
jgi:DNA modification methylase